jgi:hypothetical protein
VHTSYNISTTVYLRPIVGSEQDVNTSRNFYNFEPVLVEYKWFLDITFHANLLKIDPPEEFRKLQVPSVNIRIHTLVR